MNSNHFLQKAEKYKIKYNELKLSIQRGGTIVTNNDIMDMIELYDKTYNLYVLYRFRYDNTLPLLDFIPLSNLIAEHKENTQHNYNHYYIKDILNCDNIQQLLETKFNKVIFTLRQDTTKVIRNMLLLNKDSIKLIDEYINFINKIVKKHEKYNELTNDIQINKGIIDEIFNKCIQIRGLVATGNNEFTKQNPEPQNLDGIRYNTNYIINILGNDYDNAVVSQGKPNKLKADDNDRITLLFNRCFNEIYKLLPKV